MAIHRCDERFVVECDLCGAEIGYAFSRAKAREIQARKGRICEDCREPVVLVVEKPVYIGVALNAEERAVLRTARFEKNVRGGMSVEVAFLDAVGRYPL